MSLNPDSQDYDHNRRTPLASLAHYELEQQLQGQPEPEDEDQEPMKILVVDRRGSFSADIERAARSLELESTVVVADHPPQLIELVQRESPDVVLASPEEMTTTGLRRLAQIHRAFPKTVIALTQGLTAPPVSMTEAAACGASEVISYPASPVKLHNALVRILNTAEALQSERVVIREVMTPAPPPPPVAVPAPVGTARVFTVTSPTGGCGKTFFATNLAAYLAGVTGGKVLLLDLDLQFGEVSLALGLRPKRTISELINEESLTEAFSEYVVDHSAGYQVLSAPADPFAAELVGPREATQVLEAARLLYDFVVVDTPPSLNEVVLAAFDQSRYLVVMATMDVPSLRNLKVFLETIERLKLPAEAVSCVLNKAEPDNGIDLGELLRVYPRGFAAVLPYAKEVSRSLNVGKPVLMVDPYAEISQKLLETGRKLVPASEVNNPGWATRLAPKGSGITGWSHRRKESASNASGHAKHTPKATGNAKSQGHGQNTFSQPGSTAAALNVGPTPWPAQAPPAPAAAAMTAREYAAPQHPMAPPPMAPPPAPVVSPYQGHSAAPAPAPAPARKGWLARLFHRRERRDQASRAPAGFASYQGAGSASNGYKATERPAMAAMEASAPTAPARPQTLAFAGSHALNSAHSARRRPPSEMPAASRKEPRR